jgi:hypothetical protein
MAKPVTLKNMAGDSVKELLVASDDNPGTPLNIAVLARAVLQLQNTVNALIYNYNLHQHSGLNAAPATNAADEEEQAAQDLFTELVED